MLRFAWPLLVLMLCTNPALADDTTAQQARNLVERLHEQLIAVMQEGLPFEIRKAQLRDTVQSSFSLDTILRVSLGAGWRELDEPQQADLRQALLALISASYAERFRRFNGHRFVTHSSNAIKPRLSVVRTRLERDDREPVQFDYHVDPNGIVNVIVNGVSDLSMRRTQYGAQFRREGFEALLREIERQTDALGADDKDTVE